MYASTSEQVRAQNLLIMQQIKVIQLTTEKGFRDAENLKSKGWQIKNVGWTSITLISPKK